MQKLLKGADMLTGRKFRLVGVLISAAAMSYCNRSNALGDGEAQTLIEKRFNEPDVGLVLGDVKFVAENPDASKGREPLSEWPIYQAFAKKKVITVSNAKDLTQNFSGWSTWLNLTQGDVRKTATIKLAENGNAGIVKHNGDFDELWVKVANIKIESSC